VKPITDEIAERGVLGAILTLGKPEHVQKLQIVSKLKPEHFYWAKHQHTFEAAVSLAEKDEPIDFITIVAEFDAIHLPKVEFADLGLMVEYMPTAGNYLQYGQRVVDRARWRARQTAVTEMTSAIAEFDHDRWRAATAALLAFAKTVEGPGAPAEARSRLRLVVDGDARTLADPETGEVVEASAVEKATIRELRVQLKGAEKEIKRLRRENADLTDDRDRKAREDGRYLSVQLLFEVWKTATGHKRSKFTTDRFEACARYLTKYGMATCEKAIAGIAYQHKVTTLKNGREEHADSWESCFWSAGSVERYANRAPRNWKPTLVDKTAEVRRPAQVAAEAARG
jgi:DnaB-like helicase N terminal domain